MKKIALIFVFVAAWNATIAAQDTLIANAPKDSYHFNHWADRDTVVFMKPCKVRGFFDEEAYSFYTPDSIQIYGLAVSLSLHDNEGPRCVCIDSSMDSVYSRVRLYERNGNTLDVLGEGIVHMRDTRVSYYLSLDKWNAFLNDTGGFSKVPTIPVYEIFFDHPVTVVDTFFVGHTYSLCIDTYDYETNILTSTLRYNYLINGFRNYLMERFKDPVTLGLHRTDNDSVRPWRFYAEYWPEQVSFFIYAITAPPDTTVNPNDTTVNPGDTTGVGLRGADMIYRYTSVMPNPATEKVRVISSFGLTRVEAYDSRGRLIDTFKNLNAYAYSLDVSSWPRGTYLLRIFTSAGPTTKKLLIQ